MISKEHINYKKTNIISIKKELSRPMNSINQTNQANQTNQTSEYSLKQSLFDPSKSSPPNEFMIKLHMRMNMYNNYVDNNDDSLDKE